jgi:transcriptional regulator with XRE-family HTH domain
MSTGRKVKSALETGIVPAKIRIKLSPGESVRMAREFQQMSQARLAQASGIPQPTISAIEAGRVNLGVERAKALARALRVHPAVLLFPSWDADETAA